MGQDLLYSVMPRLNFVPSQLAYNRRVSKSDRTQTRSKYNEDHEENFDELYRKALGEKKHGANDKLPYGYQSIDDKA